MKKNLQNIRKLRRNYKFLSIFAKHAILGNMEPKRIGMGSDSKGMDFSEIIDEFSVGLTISG